jgi:hypothetical protein
MAAVELDLNHLFASGFARRHRRKNNPHSRTAENSYALDSLAPEIEPEIDPTPFEDLLYEARKGARRRLGRFADRLGLPVKALDDLFAGVLNDRLVIPERDDKLRVVGLTYRDRNGDKVCEPGSHRGLIVPIFNPNEEVPLYIVEGATDAAAVHAVGGNVIGRPGALASRLTKLWLSRRLRSSRRNDSVMLGARNVVLDHGYAASDIIVVGDRDAVKYGRSPGRDGAIELARFLTIELGGSVRWALPQKGYKDVREQVVAGDWAHGLVVREVQG